MYGLNKRYALNRQIVSCRRLRTFADSYVKLHSVVCHSSVSRNISSNEVDSLTTHLSIHYYLLLSAIVRENVCNNSKNVKSHVFGF